MGALLEKAALQDWYSICPLQRSQSFRNGLLQHWSHCGATGPARSLLQHGLSVDCSVNIFITTVLHALQGYSLCHQGLLLQGNLLRYLMHVLLLHSSKCLQACFSHIFLTFFSHSSYAAFLTLS